MGRSQRRGPKGWERSDERIKEDLCERLSNGNELDASEVTVEVRQGIVTLDGTVVERWMRYSLEDLADSVPGVKDVQNNVRLARDSQPTSAHGSGVSGSAASAEPSGMSRSSASSGSPGGASGSSSPGGASGTSSGTTGQVGTGGLGSSASRSKE